MVDRHHEHHECNDKHSEFTRLFRELGLLREAIARGAIEIARALRNTHSPAVHNTIHVTQVELKSKENSVPAIDHMPPIQLPATTLRAKLAVVNARKADGSRVDSVAWSTSNEADLPLEAIADDTVKDETGADVLDPADNLPLKVFSTYANTPNETAGEGTVTIKSAGMADCDIVVKYSDPAQGHFAIFASEAPESDSGFGIGSDARRNVAGDGSGNLAGNGNRNFDGNVNRTGTGNGRRDGTVVGVVTRDAHGNVNTTDGNLLSTPDGTLPVGLGGPGKV